MKPLGSLDTSKAIEGKRDVFFRKLNCFTKTDIFDMEKLGTGNVIEGPAILETPVTTIVVHPEQRAKIDEYLNVAIKTKLSDQYSAMITQLFKPYFLNGSNPYVKINMSQH